MGGIPVLKGLYRRSNFPPENRIALVSNFATLQKKGRKIHASPRTFRSKIHPKGPELALEEN